MTNPATGMARAIGLGTLAASITLLLGSQILTSGAVPWHDLGTVAALLMGVAVFALILISAGALFLGLPVVILLARLDCAGAETIGLAGAITGAGLFLVPAWAGGTPLTAGLFAFVVAALVGGGVTGGAWGMALDRADAGQPASSPHPNRLHDERILR